MRLFLLGIMALNLTACMSQVPAGHVGVKVYLLGSSKGVDHEVLGVGRYYIGYNEQLYLFPTFQQNYVWTQSPHEGASNDESVTFQTKEGMNVNADIGINFHIDSTKVTTVFQKYRKGVDDIRDVYLRNYVRDAFQAEASKYPVEHVYGEGKKQLIDSVSSIVREKVAPEGIVLDNLYLVGSFRLPDAVTAALNSKIEATQKAQQAENEVATAKAEANKLRAQAQGIADSNRLKAASITPALIEWEKLQKWNGVLPQVTGSSALINLK